MKRYLLGIFAIALAVGFSSFGLKSTNTVGEKWFVFHGDATTSEISNPEFYSLDNENGSAPTECTTSETQTYRCEILIQPSSLDNTKPDLSQPVVAEIKRANP